MSQDNGWYERGELPPVGSHLEVTFGNKSTWHECVVLPGKKIAIDRYAGWHVMGWQDDFEFMPIKTEREKFVERAKDDFKDYAPSFYDRLWDSGLRYTE